jgi:transcriptional regulator with XRE-family HTH domain
LEKDIVLIKKVASVVKSLRLAQGLTQQDVYYDTGIHIGRVESFKTNLSIFTINTLCKYFDISLVEFFKRVEKA